MNIFRGGFWGHTMGPKRAILGHKTFSLLFFSCPYIRLRETLVIVPSDRSSADLVMQPQHSPYCFTMAVIIKQQLWHKQEEDRCQGVFLKEFNQVC